MVAGVELHAPCLKEGTHSLQPRVHALNNTPSVHGHYHWNNNSIPLRTEAHPTIYYLVT